MVTEYILLLLVANFSRHYNTTQPKLHFNTNNGINKSEIL